MQDLYPKPNTDLPVSIHELARKIAFCSQANARLQIPEKTALMLEVLPLSVLQNGSKRLLFVATPRKLQTAAIQGLRLVTDLEIRCIHQDSEILKLAIPLAYSLDGTKLLAAAKKLNSPLVQAPLEVLKASGEPALFVEQLLTFACAQQASDIHLDPLADGLHIRLRIQGQLKEHSEALVSLESYLQISARLKVLAKLDSTVRTKPQDGSFAFSALGLQHSTRVSVLPTIFGEKIVLRLMQDSQALKLQDLGFPEEVLVKLLELLGKCEGLLVVSGITGSGKTTTLYALLEELRRESLNIVSVEDPVERKIPGINQVMANEQTGLSIGSCLRAVLRQDPDVIMVGEIRDSESARLAAQAALTGHLVLTSVHAGNLNQTKGRLLQLGIKKAELALSLRAIVCQKLANDGAGVAEERKLAISVKAWFAS